MNSVPVTLEELIAAHTSGEVRLKLQRALDAERATAKRAIQAHFDEMQRAKQTLRDEFAKAALTGALARLSRDDDFHPAFRESGETDADVAKRLLYFTAQAYCLADAMLDARELKK